MRTPPSQPPRRDADAQGGDERGFRFVIPSPPSRPDRSQPAEAEAWRGITAGWLDASEGSVSA